MIWGSNVPQTRTPDAHFYTEVRYKGTKSVVDLARTIPRSPSSSDLWLHPSRAPTPRSRMAMGHVILREFHLDRQAPYFQDYCRQLHRHADAGDAGARSDGQCVPDRFLRAST